MATISSSEAPPGGKARFSLWPLPDLRLSAERSIAVSDGSDGDSGSSDYDRGYAEGMRTAQRESDERIADALRALTTVCQKLGEAQQRHEGNNERAVHALAIAVAEQIIQREISTDETIVRKLVRKAMEDVGNDGPITVRVNPDDLELIVQDPMWKTTEASDVEWIPDSDITRGGCVVETTEQLVDGRIEASLKELFQRLNDV